MFYFILLFFVLIAGLLAHIFHELMHRVVGQLVGLKYIKTEWFKYHGGTKVLFEDEPDFSQENVRVSWQYCAMSAAGILSTTFMGYILSGVFFCLPANYLKLFVWIACASLLINDAGYALIGSIGDGGDTYAVRIHFGWSRMKMSVISAILLTVNLGYFLIVLCGFRIG